MIDEMAAALDQFEGELDGLSNLSQGNPGKLA
jgi:hypothetical protein